MYGCTDVYNIRLYVYIVYENAASYWYIAFFIYLLSMIIEKKYEAEETIKLNPKPIEL